MPTWRHSCPTESQSVDFLRPGEQRGRKKFTFSKSWLSGRIKCSVVALRKDALRECGNCSKGEEEGQWLSKPTAFYIKATAGEKAEWQPIMIKNSTAEHQSPIVAGMKHTIWRTLTHIWLAAQISSRLDSRRVDRAVRKTKKDGGENRKDREEGATKRLGKRGRKKKLAQNEILTPENSCPVVPRFDWNHTSLHLTQI